MTAKRATRVKVRLVFADEGAFHHETIAVPTKVLDRHARLIDAIREDDDMVKELHVDVDRLVSAYRVEDED